MNAVRTAIAIGLAAAAIGAAACGDDAGDGTGSGSPGQGAAAPAPATAFDTLTTALEGQGLAVSKLPPSSLDGAEAGISISGDQAGSARLFKTQQQADAYAKRAAAAGDSTTTVGTAVFQSGSQAGADSFADAYTN